MRLLFAGIASAAVIFGLGACSPYSSSENAAEYLGPLLNDVTNVEAIGICTRGGENQNYIAVQFSDDAISSYRLPNSAAGETKPEFEWVKASSQRPTYGDSGCLYEGTPIEDDGGDFLVTVHSPGRVSVQVRDAVTKYASFDEMKAVLQQTAAAVHQAVVDHKGWVEPQKTWN